MMPEIQVSVVGMEQGRAASAKEHRLAQKPAAASLL